MCMYILFDVIPEVGMDKWRHVCSRVRLVGVRSKSSLWWIFRDGKMDEHGTMWPCAKNIVHHLLGVSIVLVVTPYGEPVFCSHYRLRLELGYVLVSARVFVAFPWRSRPDSVFRMVGCSPMFFANQLLAGVELFRLQDVHVFLGVEVGGSVISVNVHWFRRTTKECSYHPT